MNLHKYYYKDYFSGVDFSPILQEGDNEISSENISEKNRELCSCPLLIIAKNDWVNKTIPLFTIYPGLVTGVGITHEASIKGEFKLGVHFDWTYGMPVIYGSSVKGVLRAYFEDLYKPNPKQPEVIDAIQDIFDGEGKSIYNRDIFFDAVIVEPEKKKKRILCSDSITPHGGENHDNPLVNPKPITFLKIAPGCIIEFRFHLVETVINKNGKEYKLSADEKREIFKEILTTVGVGAKTNVGYGQLKEVK